MLSYLNSKQVVVGFSFKNEGRGTLVVVTPGGGWGALPSNRLLGMYRWMGPHFHDSTDYNAVIFSSVFNRLELVNGVALFRDFESMKIVNPNVTKKGSIISHKID